MKGVKVDNSVTHQDGSTYRLASNDKSEQQKMWG